MTEINHRAPEVLRAEILAEARRRADDILKEAREEAASILDRARAAAAQAREAALAAARAEGARQAGMILETVPVEAGRRRAARIEFALKAIHDEIRRRVLVCEGFDCRQAVVALAAGALRRMEGDAFLVKLPASDREELGQGLAEEIARRADRGPLQLSVDWDPAIVESGVVVHDAAGRRVWDNRFTARLERLWPELRRRMAVEAGLVGASAPAGGTP